MFLWSRIPPLLAVILLSTKVLGPASGKVNMPQVVGALVAGLLLCNLSDVRPYVNRKMEILSYMLFAPLFFASVGIKTGLRGMAAVLPVFAVLLVVAIFSKISGRRKIF